jgi:hypothetical protein
VGASHGDDFHLVPDVPADLGSATFLPWQIVRNQAGVYGSVLVLPAGTAIDALHRTDVGTWLISVESPALLGEILALPSDVLEIHDPPGEYSKRFDGAANGVPPGANVDAIFLDGDLILSFDAPTTLAGQTFEPADLVRFAGGSFTLYFDASAVVPPIPPMTNVTGADKQGNLTLLTFDVPTALGGYDFRPGHVTSWDGAFFLPFYADPAWPAGAVLQALAYLAHAGRVPATMRVAIASPPGGRLRLRISWNASCSTGAEDYAIYEGAIGQWYSHTRLDCSDEGGDLTEEVTPSAGDRYYLVVPLNANAEGSHGTASDQTERPVGITSCGFVQTLAPCP